MEQDDQLVQTETNFQSLPKAEQDLIVASLHGTEIADALREQIKRNSQ